MTTATISGPFGQLEKEQSTSPELQQLDQFADWFSRRRNTLHFMADLILNSSELAERAVQNCWEKASGNPPSFESEGDFCGWIFRLLIHEALSMPSGRY